MALPKVFGWLVMVLFDFNLLLLFLIEINRFWTNVTTPRSGSGPPMYLQIGRFNSLSTLAFFVSAVLDDFLVVNTINVTSVSGSDRKKDAKEPECDVDDNFAYSGQGLLKDCDLCAAINYE